MAYEFTKQKINTERKKQLRRILLSLVGGAIGFGIGVVSNDMSSLFGLWSASMVSAIGASITYYIAG